MKWQRCTTGILATLFGVASLADAAGVTYSARVDRGGKAWVDVENETARDIDVRSVELTFDDGDGQRIGRQSLPCQEDCQVKAGAKGSFGPIDGPRGWESFSIEKLLYVDGTGHSAGSAPAPPAPSSKLPPPIRKPTGAIVAPASEVLTCNEYCRLLGALPGCSARADIPACVESCRDAERMTACRPAIDRFFRCVAKEPPNCVDGRPAFGGCGAAEREYRGCLRE